MNVHYLPLFRILLDAAFTSYGSRHLPGLWIHCYHLLPYHFSRLALTLPATPHCCRTCGLLLTATMRLYCHRIPGPAPRCTVSAAALYTTPLPLPCWFLTVCLGTAPPTLPRHALPPATTWRTRLLETPTYREDFTPPSVLQTWFCCRFDSLHHLPAATTGRFPLPTVLTCVHWVVTVYLPVLHLAISAGPTTTATHTTCHTAPAWKVPLAVPVPPAQRRPLLPPAGDYCLPPPYGSPHCLEVTPRACRTAQRDGYLPVTSCRTLPASPRARHLTHTTPPARHCTTRLPQVYYRLDCRYHGLLLNSYRRRRTCLPAVLPTILPHAFHPAGLYQYPVLTPPPYAHPAARTTGLPTCRSFWLPLNTAPPGTYRLPAATRCPTPFPPPPPTTPAPACLSAVGTLPAHAINALPRPAWFTAVRGGTTLRDLH